MKRNSLAFLVLFAVCSLSAQSNSKATAYILKGGLSAGTQKWDNSDRQLLFSYHGALAIESADADSDRYSLFAQIGYHNRGSANRFNFNILNGGQSRFTQTYEFQNIALILGAKQKKPLSESTRYFYFAGVRGEYNLSDNLDSDELQSNLFFLGLNSANTRKVLGGVSFGGGFEMDFGELAGAVFELSIHPDFTNQYFSPPLQNSTVTNPFTGQQISIPERRIRNTTIELSVGIKLVRKVIYDL